MSCEGVNMQRILLEEAPFSVRASSVLKLVKLENGTPIEFLDQLNKITALDLMENRNFGLKTLREVRRVLAMYGLSLRGDMVLDSEAEKKNDSRSSGCHSRNSK